MLILKCIFSLREYQEGFVISFDAQVQQSRSCSLFTRKFEFLGRSLLFCIGAIKRAPYKLIRRQNGGIRMWRYERRLYLRKIPIFLAINTAAHFPFPLEISSGATHQLGRNLNICPFMCSYPFSLPFIYCGCQENEFS